MEHLHQTPLHRSAFPAAIVANAGLAAMLTTMLIMTLVLLATSLAPVRGRRSTAASTSPTATADFRCDEDSVSSAEELSAGVEGNECCICLEEPSADSIASISGCEHTFCAECIIRWAGARNVCPLCRTLFTSIESADGVLQQVSGRRPAAADLASTFDIAGADNILARLLGREEVQTRDDDGVGSLNEVFWRSVHEHEAYWSAIVAAITNTLNEVHERKNQLNRRTREVRERNREVRERNDHANLMNDELAESCNNLRELLRTRYREGDGPSIAWLRNEVQQLENRDQQVKNELDLIRDEIDQIKDEVDLISDEFDQINDEMDQIRDETHQIIRDAVDQFGSASPLPTLANLPTLRRAAQIVINGENMFDLTTEMLANFQA